MPLDILNDLSSLVRVFTKTIPSTNFYLLPFHRRKQQSIKTSLHVKRVTYTHHEVYRDKRNCQYSMLLLYNSWKIKRQLFYKVSDRNLHPRVKVIRPVGLCHRRKLSILIGLALKLISLRSHSLLGLKRLNEDVKIISFVFA